MKKIRIDPELGRLSIALHQASSLRVWGVLRHIVRCGNGSGKLDRSAVPDILKQFGIHYGKRHLNRLLKQGEGLYWNLTSTRLFIRSSRYVAQKLTSLALQANPDAIRTNKPGVKDVYVSPEGSLENWEAELYRGWLTHRENPTISREVLSRLFNRTDETLRRWEESHLSEHLTVRANYAQQPGDEDTINRHFDYLPEHTRSYMRQIGDHLEHGLTWRISNTYLVKGCRQHPHKGQSSKVRRAVNVEFNQPANARRGGLPGLKLYFDSITSLRPYLKKYGGVRYLWRGENRHGHGVFEANANGIVETHSKERASFKRERDYFRLVLQKRDQAVME